MPVRRCHYLKADGTSCQSPPLRGEKYCHAHLRFKGRPVRTWRGQRSDPPDRLLVPPPKNLREHQIRLTRVIHAILENRIDLDRAGRVLYELEQIGAKLRAAEFPDIAAKQSRLTAEMKRDGQFVAELQEDGRVCLSNKSFGIKIEI
jgi:hypothetical protein